MFWNAASGRSCWKPVQASGTACASGPRALFSRGNTISIARRNACSRRPLEFPEPDPVSDRRRIAGALSRAARHQNASRYAHSYREPRHRHQPYRFDKLKTTAGGRPFRNSLSEWQGPKSRKSRCIIDASGTWHSPNPAGANGLNAIGERQAAQRLRTGCRTCWEKTAAPMPANGRGAGRGTFGDWHPHRPRKTGDHRRRPKRSGCCEQRSGKSFGAAPMTSSPPR